MPVQQIAEILGLLEHLFETIGIVNLRKVYESAAEGHQLEKCRLVRLLQLFD